MTITRDQYLEGYTWDEWLEVVRARREEWHGRYESARLGPLRADYTDVPAPRSVLCLVDDAEPDSVGTIPYIARACDEAGDAAGVGFRILRGPDHPELVRQFLMHGRTALPICVVFDQDWIQVGVWGHRPRPAERLCERLADRLPPEALRAELERWYAEDQGRTTLAEFLDVLRGAPVPPARSERRMARHLHTQVERAHEHRWGHGLRHG